MKRNFSQKIEEDCVVHYMFGALEYSLSSPGSVIINKLHNFNIVKDFLFCEQFITGKTFT